MRIISTKGLLLIHPISTASTSHLKLKNKLKNIIKLTSNKYPLNLKPLNKTPKGTYLCREADSVNSSIYI